MSGEDLPTSIEKVWSRTDRRRAPGSGSGDHGRLVSVPVSVHLPASDRTLAVWLDLAPDLSSADSTQAYCVDVEHQPTDLAVGGSNPSRRANKPQLSGPVTGSLLAVGSSNCDHVGGQS
jgi:hypothetical protein